MKRRAATFTNDAADLPLRPVDQLLALDAKSRVHAVNERVPFTAIPVFMFSLVGLMMALLQSMGAHRLVRGALCRRVNFSVLGPQARRQKPLLF